MKIEAIEKLKVTESTKKGRSIAQKESVMRRQKKEKKTKKIKMK